MAVSANNLFSSMKQEVRSSTKAEKGVEKRKGKEEFSRRVGDLMNYGNTAGFLGSIKDLLEVSDRELRVRSENTLGVRFSPGVHPQSRQSVGFTRSCGLAKQV